MNVLPITRFAAAAAGIRTPLPSGPTLSLPGGLLGAYNQGRVFAYERWVVAVGIAPDLFLVLGNCSERHAPRALLEQLTGYLSACGAEVVRTRMRFPIGWHDTSQLARTVLYWIRQFVGTLSVSVEARLDQERPRLLLPVADLTRQAGQEWLWIEAIMRSVENEYPELLPRLEWLLWDISHQWEIRWALTLRDAEVFDSVNWEERIAIERCDRTWIVLVRRYLEPRGYELLPNTIARLL